MARRRTVRCCYAVGALGRGINVIVPVDGMSSIDAYADLTTVYTFWHTHRRVGPKVHADAERHDQVLMLVSPRFAGRIAGRDEACTLREDRRRPRNESGARRGAGRAAVAIALGGQCRYSVPAFFTRRRPMSQLILAIQNGPHDGSAAVLADYEVKAAVQLERLTRIKGDGGFPDLAIDEVLDIAGATRRDVDIVAVSRWDFPVQYFRHFRGWRWLREQYRTHVEGKKTRFMPREALRANDYASGDVFRRAGFSPRRRFSRRRQRLPSTTITRRTRCRHCSTPIGTTRCW